MDFMPSRAAEHDLSFPLLALEDTDMTNDDDDDDDKAFGACS